MHKRKRTSEVWNYYEKIDGTVALCNLCKKVISYHSSVSNLRKHIERKHVLDLDPLLQLNDSESDMFEDADDSGAQPEKAPSPAYNVYVETLAGHHGASKSPQKSQLIEITEINLNKLDHASMMDLEKGFKWPLASLQELVDARKTSNNLKEHHLNLDKMQNEIFSHFLTIFRNMSVNNYTIGFMRRGDRDSPVSPSTKRKPGDDVKSDDEDELEIKYPRTRETYDNDHPEFNENWLKDLHIEEKKIEIDERRLKLEERKVVMQGQMEERKIQMDERKLKLEKQKVNSDDQNEEMALEIDEAQMKLNEERFMLEVRIEEKKLEIDEKRLKLEKRKVFLQEQKKLCNGE